MNRPRTVAIVSAVAASTAAFVVTSRYQLAGTLAGAALVPVIIILVSHTSMAGVDALHRWTRLRRRGGAAGDPPAAAEAPATVAAPEGATTSAAARAAETAGPSTSLLKKPSRVGRLAYSQWWMAGLACAAMAVSVYALVAHENPTVVRQTVIQRVTESSEGGTTTVSTSAEGPDPTTATTSGRGTTPSTSASTTDTTDTSVVQPAETTTTSTTSALDQGATPSTTDSTQGGASLP